MKFFALVLLFAVVFCSPLAKKENQDPIDIIKCVVEKVGPMTPDVVELLDAIKEKDWIKVAICAAKLVEEGRETFLECFKKEILQINWSKFGQCLLKNGAQAIPDLQEIVKAVLEKDWAKVKELALHTAIKVLPIIVDCYNKSDSKDK